MVFLYLIAIRGILHLNNHYISKEFVDLDWSMTLSYMLTNCDRHFFESWDKITQHSFILLLSLWYSRFYFNKVCLVVKLDLLDLLCCETLPSLGVHYMEELAVWLGR